MLKSSYSRSSDPFLPECERKPIKKEKRSKMKKFFALLLALVMSLSLVACGGGDTANEDTSTDDTATEENGGDTATASDVEIAVVLKTLASEYWGYVKAGCDAAAADLGVTVHVVGPGAESEIEQQVSMIEQQIGAGCDAIIVAPNAPFCPSIPMWASRVRPASWAPPT